MKRNFPPTKRTATLVLLSIILLVTAGFTATGASASVFSSISTGLDSAINAWWSQPQQAVTAASVTTDKADYSPGETIQITGSGFGANDVVTLKVTDVGPAGEYVHSGYGTWTVNADSAGAFSASWLVGTESLNRKLLLTADGAPSLRHAETTFTDGAIGGYDQCSNSPDGDGYDNPPGEGCKWINGNLNASKSSYPEGTATVQRVELSGFGPNENHSVTFQYGTTKNGKHAYDFLTSWNWSENWITEADRCEGIAGCVGLSDVKAPIPHDPALDPFTNGGVLWEDASVSPNPPDQPREFWMCGATYQPTPVTGPTPDVGDYSGTSETLITVNFRTPNAGEGMCTSGGNATCRVVIWFGAHVARSADWFAENGTTGAGGISGSPYHVATFRLDDAAIGNRDNQMQANAVVSQSLEVRKVLVPAADPGRFDLRIDAGQASQFIATNQGNGGTTLTQPVSVGNHNVSEIGGTIPATDLANYTSTLSCITTDDQGVAGAPVNYGTTPSQTVPVGSGEIVVCTFTNTKKATVTITKIADPANGQDFTFNTTGSGPAGWSPSFILEDDGPGGTSNSRTFTFDPTQLGAKTVTEVPVLNWALQTLVCSEGTTDPLNGVASFTVDAGDAITCTYTNRNRSLLEGRIIVDKVTNPSGDTQLFDFNASWLAGGPPDFQLADATTPFDSGLLIPGAYSVTETVPTGWSLGSVVCTSSLGGTEDNTAISLQAAEIVTCVFTNNKDATLKIVKQATPEGAQVFGFTGTGTDVSANFSLVDDGVDNDASPNNVTFTFQSGEYGAKTVTESVPTGWTLTSANCVGGTDTNGATATVAVNIAAGDTVICTYNNSAPDLSIKVEANDTNEVGDPHQFTVTVTQVPNGATPATTADITRSVTPTPNLTNTTTCGVGVSFMGGNVATCTITVNSSVAGVFDVDASVTATIGGLSVSRSTNGTSGPGGNSGATKTYVDARITIGSNGTNEVGVSHPFTATVYENTGTGEVAAANETVTLSITSGTATFVTNGAQSITCVTNASGQCTQSITSNTPGVVTVNAAVGVSVGGLTVNRSTNSTHGSSGPATKTYVDGRIAIAASATNEVSVPHPFTATVLQNPGTGLVPVVGTTVTLTITAGTATFVDNGMQTITCVTDANGQCTKSINSATAGSNTVSASATFSVGGVSLTRATDSTHGSSGPATKLYVDMSIAIAATATNNVNVPHVFMVTVTKYPSSASGATVNVTTSVNPVPPTLGATNCNVALNFNASGIATCSFTINSDVAGVYAANASATAAIGGVSLARDTNPSTPADAGPGGSGPAVKTYVAGSITIIKDAVPNGSQTFAYTTNGTGLSSFTLDDDGNNANAFSNTKVFNNLAPGSYTVTETLPVTGWTATGLDCTGGGANTTFNVATGVSSIGLDAGENVVCTYVNTKNAKLTVVKVTDPANSGADSFPFTVTGQTGFSLDTNAATAGILSSQVFNYNGSGYGSITIDEGATAGWTPTNLVCTAGQSTSIDTATGVAVVTVDPGDDITCTYTNTKNAKLTVVKVTDPANSGADSFPFTAAGSGTSNFTLDTNAADLVNSNQQVFNFDGNQLGAKSVTESAVPGWDLISAVCTGGTDTNGALATVAVTIAAGSDVTCTFNNKKRGTVVFSKTENGGATQREFTFEIRKGASLSSVGTVVANATVPTGSDDQDDFAFDCVDNSTDCEDIGTPAVANFKPGTYYFCETNLMVGWTQTLSSIGTVFTPNGNDPSADNSDQCVEITITAGGNLNLGTIDNIPPPEGDAHTIGYWKNWTSCDGRGNQRPVMDYILWSFGKYSFVDGADAPNEAPSTVGDGLLLNPPILDDPSSYDPGVMIGDLNVDTCAEAVTILSKQLIPGKVKGKNRSEATPFTNLASQLLAAKLNVQAGAGAPCNADLILRAQQYLDYYNFDGISYLKPTGQDAARMALLAGYLDDYNNNELVCPISLPPPPPGF